MIRSYSSLLFWLGLTIAASLMLYHTSDRVTELDQQMRTLGNQIDAEQQSLHVLKAEWVYLANPARIGAEAQRHLGLTPTATRRVASLQNMAALLPMRDGMDATSTVLTASAAQAVPAPVAAKASAEAPVVQAAVHNKRDRILASLNAGRINDHMIMTHAAAEVSTDKIGALIGTLGLHP